jgi:hypothetical protein
MHLITFYEKVPGSTKAGEPTSQNSQRFTFGRQSVWRSGLGQVPDQIPFHPANGQGGVYLPAKTVFPARLLADKPQDPGQGHDSPQNGIGLVPGPLGRVLQQSPGIYMQGTGGLTLGRLVLDTDVFQLL